MPEAWWYWWYIGTGVGDEGGFAPPVETARDALQLLTEATKRAGHTDKVKFAVDSASSEFFKGGRYDLDFKSQKATGEHTILSHEGLGDMYRELVKEYPIALWEDPFAEDDWTAWSAFLKTHIERGGDAFEIVGDDLLATNIKRMEIAREKKGEHLTDLPAPKGPCANHDITHEL